MCAFLVTMNAACKANAVPALGIPSKLLSSSAMPDESQAKHGIFVIETLIT
ncbi:hypothetical protein [Burkholderia sp. BCC0397]|uniref:hypothetical protein n=1 Tax=Burkholderia sp. BCC0397 TaxID=486876 RepID=UPI00158C0ACA|nr:hypothetical protein [Burkholderia sp. BCC0397]